MQSEPRYEFDGLTATSSLGIEPGSGWIPSSFHVIIPKHLVGCCSVEIDLGILYQGSRSNNGTRPWGSQVLALKILIHLISQVNAHLTNQGIFKRAMIVTSDGPDEISSTGTSVKSVDHNIIVEQCPLSFYRLP